MTISEKILYCRKKAGLSQEALADIIGVSRQSISKWETGESVPEIGKLPLLAKIFGVSTDWLLSEDEPAAPEPIEKEAPAPEKNDWVESIPGVIGKLIRQYGWLYGVYTALAGVGFTVIGFLARILPKMMLSFDPFGSESGYFDGYSMGSGTIWYDEAGNIIPDPTGGSQISSFAENNPVSVMGTVIIVIGVVMIIAGTALAIYLKKRNK